MDLKAQKDFGHIKEKENTKNVIGSGDKRSGSDCRVNTSFIENDGNKSTDQCCNDDDAHHGSGNGEADDEVLLDNRAKKYEDKREGQTVDQA